MNNSLNKKDVKALKKYFKSHAEVARQLGITPIYYCAIRNGREVPSKILINSTVLLAKYVRIEEMANR